MKLHQKTILKILLLLFVITGGFLIVQTVSAQIEPGVNIVGEEIALPTEDPRIVAARIIRVALGFLGIIALVIILYGGFIWMTAAGNEERILKAKKILTSGAIGLLIIVSAFGITQFVLNKLMEAAGVGVEGPPGPPGPPPGLPPDAFIVRSISPSGDIPIRNVVVRVIFNRNILGESLTGNFIVKRTADESEVEGEVSASQNVAEFTPTAACPEPNQDRKCFDANTEFVVEVTTEVRSADGKSLICGGLAPPCQGIFTTGDLVDVTGPTVEITYPDPGQSVSTDDLIPINAYSTDDAGIAYLEYFVDGGFIGNDSPTDTPREYFSSIDWDTTGITLGSRHALTSKVFDIDTNDTTSSPVDVTVRAAHCFDGEQNYDETGIDCGGVDCGGCEGDSCTSDDDCAGGHCEDGVCVNLPMIIGVAPDNGAPGNYITIFGQYFRSEPGRVVFLGDEGGGDDKVASLAACLTPWQDNQIVVEVPEGASDGPMRVEEGTTGNNYADQTNDERGPLLPNFDVNETLRPGLCSVEPTSGAFKTEVALTGINFGSQDSGDEVTFGGTRAERVIGWDDTLITATVPNIAPAVVSVQATKAGESSNPVNFEVTTVAEAPSILSFEPTSGPIGEYVTILGSNFGDTPGAVFFKNPEGQDLLAATDFPPACGTGWWKNDQVTVKVPEGAVTSILKLTTADGLTDDTSDLSPSRFEVIEGAPSPGLCRLAPDNGPAGLEITLYGERLGTTGQVKFWENKTAEIIKSWQDMQIEATVPEEAETGPVQVEVEDKTSNQLNFTVRDCRDARTPCPEGGDCCADGSCAAPGECELPAGRGHYFWQFSTGEIPVYPQVVEECTGPPPDNPSPSPTPWSARGQTSVCVNAKISARFNTLIDTATLISENVIVEKCQDGEACATVESISGNISYLQMVDLGQTRLDFTPTASFETNKWYQVTLTDGIESQDEFQLDGDRDGQEGGNYIFKFKTRESSEPCEVGWVGVQPYQETAAEEGQQLAYQADAIAANDYCLLLDFVYSSQWRIDDPEARLPLRASVEEGWCLSGDPPAWQECGEEEYARVTARLETVPGSDVQVVARIPEEDKEGSGDLKIDFTDPKIVEKWPDCQEACINAQVGARFNTNMIDVASGPDWPMSVKNPANINLYLWKCGNGIIESGEDCDDGNTTPGDGCSASCLNEGTSICSDPATDFNCCGNGRREIGEDCDGVPLPDGCKYIFGAIDNCTNLGSPACGDGVVQEGEDCDDGNTASADGCSSTCLNEGTDGLTRVGINNLNYTDIDQQYILWFYPGVNFKENTWYRAVVSGQAASRSKVGLTGLNYDSDGDTAIDSYSWTFKTKDDSTPCAVDHVGVIPEETKLYYIGAEQNYLSTPYGSPDQCNPRGQPLQAMDYNWGWTSQYTQVATVSTNNNHPKCGNKVVEFGEDCDDGNTTSGDGCDANCLNEGSTDDAVCGNNQIELGEDCDDGNAVSGDGCNSQCFNEGSIAGGSTCGDGQVGRGEDCDDGNATSGDGCSNTCLNEGTIEDAYFDPLQTATTKGVLEGETESTTEIRAETQGVRGIGELTMVCGYGPRKACPADPPDLGVGTDTCCHPKPKVEMCDPSGASDQCSSGATGVCRNAKITINFDQEMDSASITGNIIIAGNYDACPEGTTKIDDGGPGERAEWCVGGDVATITTASRLDDMTKTVVDVYLQKLLEETRKYKVIVRGDNEATDDVVEGVKNKKGVALAGPYYRFHDGDNSYQSFAWTFTTSPDICILEKVVIDPSFYLFTSSSSVAVPPETTPPNQRDFNADAQDWRGYSISPIPLVYDWEWAWTSNIPDEGEGSEDNVVSISRDNLDDPVLGATQTATAQNRNGEEVISATATMTADVILDTVGETTTGQADVIVFICENPWPEDFYTNDAYQDEDYNFKIYYCQDRGEGGRIDDDLPTLSDLMIPYTPDSDVKDELLREFFFFPQGVKYCSLSLAPCEGTFGACPSEAGECRGTPDAIGVRIYENADHLPLVEWYLAQGLAFGGPESIEVDGYGAIRDGRTTYVMAANDTEGESTLYTNVYLISYSQGANPDTVEIYSQLLDNLRFNINLTNSRLCKMGDSEIKRCAGDTAKPCTFHEDCVVDTADKGPCSVVNCSRDLDCPKPTHVCQAPKDKLVRDVQRILDLQNIAGLVEGYKRTTGYYPKLEAGTYIRALTASVWGSWQGVLGNEVQTSLPVDPINKIIGCTGTGYDPGICWNVDDAKYQCPAGSHIYQYKFIPSEGAYKLESDFEYKKTCPFSDCLRTLWDKPLDGERFVVLGTCEGRIFQNEGICGDGVINFIPGTDPPQREECEIGMIKHCSDISPNEDMRDRGCTTDTDCGTSDDPSPPPDVSWCVAKEESCATDPDHPEILDGRQAFDCDPGTCLWREVGACSILCGDGVVQTGEQCDQGPTGGRVPRGGTSEENQYACTPGCTWDNSGWCGDGIPQTAYGERCDDGEEYNGNYGKYCSVPEIPYEPPMICLGGVKPYCKLDCSGPGLYCGDEIVNGSEECDTLPQTSKGICYSDIEPSPDTSTTGSPCERDTDCNAGSCSITTAQSCRTDADCPEAETCENVELCALCPPESGTEYPQFRTRNCKEGGADQCTWENWGVCSPIGACGNGVKEGDEECDDGNDDNSDGCIITNSGGVYGPNNCKTARCGDGYILTGVENCDAGENNGVPCTARYGETCNYCSTDCAVITLTGDYCGDGTKNGPELCDNREGTGLTCETDPEGSQYIVSGTDKIKVPDILDCREQPTAPAPLEWDRPMCMADCGSTCPPTYDTQTLTFEGGRNTIELASADDETVPESEKKTQINLPACRILGEIKADVDTSGIERIPLNVVFVTDRSGSMSGTRIENAKAALAAAVGQLFDSYDKVKIGLVSYGTEGQIDSGLAESRMTLISIINSYEADLGSTNIADGFKKAQEILSDTEHGSENVIILMSDGEATRPYQEENGDVNPPGFEYPQCVDYGGTDYAKCAASIEANTAKDNDREIYTIFYGGESEEMEVWSSGCQLSGDIGQGSFEKSPYYDCVVPPDHYFSAAADLAEVYSTIIDALTAAIVDLNGIKTPGVRDGLQVPLNIDDIRCEGTSQNFNFSVEFSGMPGSTIRISNLRAYFCSGPPFP